MDILKLNIKVLKPGHSMIIEKIHFEDVSFVEIIINNENLLFENAFYEGSFLVFSELEKSMFSEGDFLLFTSVSGVADAAGWDLCKVKHLGDFIEWEINREDYVFKYLFDKSEYIKEIEDLNSKKKLVIEDFPLEPKYIIFPE